MAYRLKLKEPVGAGLQRVLLEQIDRATAELDLLEDRVRHIHEARKSMKRARAALRLLRPGIGEPMFTETNARLRDIARHLAMDRDRDVMRLTLARLAPAATAADRRLIDTVASSLAHPTEPAASGEGVPTVAPGGATTARGELTDARGRIAELELDTFDISIATRGLARTFGRLIESAGTAFEHHTDEAFHEVRKGAQHHWRQMLLLSRAWPDYCEARSRLARRISVVLGEDHDYAMLAAYVETGAHALDKRARARLAQRCRSTQAELRREVEPMVARLTADRPKGLARRIAIYWEMSRKAAKLARDAEKPVAKSKAQVDGARPPSKRTKRSPAAK